MTETRPSKKMATKNSIRIQTDCYQILPKKTLMAQ